MSASLSTPRRSLSTLVVGLLLAVATLLVPGWRTPLVAAAAPTSSTSSSHPYGDPVWFPLRTPAKIGCAKSGCGTSADHGYFAIDLLGAEGDPIYAAGAGVVHVGANSGSCGDASETDGRWLWIDHGGGFVSRYHHLAEIAVHDGDLVTPATRIGAMGHSGDVAPCKTSYLHFEVRQDGVRGERIDFGLLRGCQSDREVVLPSALGFSSWNDPGLHPVRRLSSPQLDSTCVRPDWLQTAGAVQPSVSRTAGSVIVSQVAPDVASSWLAQLEVWRPSLKEWRELDHREAPTVVSSIRFPGLDDSRRYRVRTSAHNAAGWSVWSRTTEARAVPGAPSSPRYLTWRHRSSSKSSYLHYGWDRPADLGSPVTSFDVSRRCGSSAATLGRWTTYTQKQKDTYRNLRGLKKAKVCEVRVRATNGVGTGPWSKVSTIRR